MINKCRICNNESDEIFIDLHNSPPSNAYLYAKNLDEPEVHYPLVTYYCRACKFVYTRDYQTAVELFTDDYAYFSSASSSWVEHAKNFCKDMASKLDLTEKSFVLEVASNDGYLLRHFMAMGIPCLGVEPTESTATKARSLGIEVLGSFYGLKLAEEIKAKKGHADLLVANNVYAHVPNLHDFTEGISKSIGLNGIVSIEVPHLVKLIENSAFDTVYHEHFSYFSLMSIVTIFSAHELRVIDVEELPTHGGSLRIIGSSINSEHVISNRVQELIAREVEYFAGEDDLIRNFNRSVSRVRRSLLEFLLDMKSKDVKVVGYGAAAKANTLLNFCGIRSDLIPYVADASDSKQGKFLPGSRIPIVSPDTLYNDRAAKKIIIFPWNIADELLNQLKRNISSGVSVYRALPYFQELR
jgi:hypothetical protein